MPATHLFIANLSTRNIINEPWNAVTIRLRGMDDGVQNKLNHSQVLGDGNINRRAFDYGHSVKQGKHRVQTAFRHMLYLNAKNRESKGFAPDESVDYYLNLLSREVGTSAFKNFGRCVVQPMPLTGFNNNRTPGSSL